MQINNLFWMHPFRSIADGAGFNPQGRPKGRPQGFALFPSAMERKGWVELIASQNYNGKWKMDKPKAEGAFEKI